MRPDDMPVLGVLRQALGYHSDRQRVLANNVANANTPGYVPEDIPASQFERELERTFNNRRSPDSVRLNATGPMHISHGSAGSREYRAESTPDSETTINGNAVVLEEQMVKFNENRLRYDTALGLYQKSLALMRMAIKPPGQ